MIGETKQIDAVSQTLKELYETTESQYKLEVQLAIKKGRDRKELLKRLKQIRKNADKMLGIVTKRAENMVGIKTSVDSKHEKMSKLLVKSAMKEFEQSKQGLKSLQRIMPLKKAIHKQTQQGIDKGLNVRVNGRNYGYKEYMEMNVRTTLQQEIGEQQLESGEKAKVVFYIASSFADSADDHADYQGKIYYDNRYKSYNLRNEKAITDFVRKENLKSVQWVRDKPVYLTTRPNCRHTLMPISMEQAMGYDPDTLLTSLQMKKGSYKDGNYELTQQQRYNERQIRKYKARAEANAKLGYGNGKDVALVRKWQKRQRRLVKSNPQLERDYRRETRDVLLQDLGAKYNRARQR